MKKRSVLLLIALIIVIIYLIMQGYNYAEGLKTLAPEATSDEETGAQIGTALGMTMLLPHIILVAIGAIFNIVAWIGKQRWAALVAAILYTVGGVLGLINVLFLIVPMILCYVAFAKSKPDKN